MDTNYTIHDHVHEQDDPYVNNNLEPIINNFELRDFIDDPNFDQFINLIRGENEDAICNFGSDLINDCFVDNINNNNNNNNQLPPCPPPSIINDANLNVYDPIPISSTTLIGSFSSFQEELKEQENVGGGGGSTSSGKTTNKTGDAKSKVKTDRSKTLVSERRRRCRMKDKLYALRALVPNITKMDKASIIGDAVSYVHGLQAQAKKLEAEVAGLEASLSVVSENNYNQESINNNVQVMTHHHNQYPIYKKIMQVEMFQVEERGYYTKIMSNKGKGVAASLYKALESLTDFNVQNSNLATVCDNYLLTLTLNVKAGFEEESNNLIPNLKLWVIGALLNQGFQLIPAFHA